MFQLRQPVVWFGQQMIVVGKTYSDPRLYVLQDADGVTYVDVDERNLDAAPLRLVEQRDD